jgi:hypothetical protein
VGRTWRITRFRACSFVSDWWVGTIPNRIVSLIYINLSSWNDSGCNPTETNKPLKFFVSDECPPIAMCARTAISTWQEQQPTGARTL